MSRCLTALAMSALLSSCQYCFVESKVKRYPNAYHVGAIYRADSDYFVRKEQDGWAAYTNIEAHRNRKDCAPTLKAPMLFRIESVDMNSDFMAGSPVVDIKARICSGPLNGKCFSFFSFVLQYHAYRDDCPSSSRDDFFVVRHDQARDFFYLAPNPAFVRRVQP